MTGLHLLGAVLLVCLALAGLSRLLKVSAWVTWAVRDDEADHFSAICRALPETARDFREAAKWN